MRLRGWRWLAGALGAVLFCGCAFFEPPGPYGNSPRKEFLPTERENFVRALGAPASPEESPQDGEFVGWYGVILETVTTQSKVTGLVLDHRYADDLNIRFGRPGRDSIHTVSLFGGGLFETATTYAGARSRWLAGDLLRVYGTVSQTAGGSWTIKPVYFRYWPRWAYEVAPLRPVWTAEGKIRRKFDESGGSWPELRWDHSVSTKNSSVDDVVRANLLSRFATSETPIKRRVAFALGELGGEESIAALREAIAGAEDEDLRRTYRQSLRRARRRIGPRWRPHAPSPYWVEEASNGRTLLGFRIPPFL